MVKIEGTTKNGQSRDTGYHTRHGSKTNKKKTTQHRKLKKMSNTELDIESWVNPHARER